MKTSTMTSSSRSSGRKYKTQVWGYYDYDSQEVRVFNTRSEARDERNSVMLYSTNAPSPVRRIDAELNMTSIFNQD